MSTEEFITEVFCRIDDQMRDVPRHSQATLYPSEVVTLAVLCALKGVGERAFCRWIERDYLPLFPHLPERTRLFRLFAAHRQWSERFLAEPTVLGIADTYGIELGQPIRQGRSPQQIGRFGKSNKRWIMGSKLCVVLNQQGLAVDWDCASANVKDNHFRPLIAEYEEKMVVFVDSGFHTSPKKGGDPANMKVCAAGTWNGRMLIERVFAMLTTVCRLKHLTERAWAYLRARLGFTLAAYNLLVQWKGLHPDDTGLIHLSIAQFSL
jgi:hypothetical protein